MPLNINMFAEWHITAYSIFKEFQFLIKYSADKIVIKIVNDYDGNFSALLCAPELETTQDLAAAVVIKLYE
ncbi:hypothetical protein PB72LOC_03331 [Pectobacterium atrosepticum]|nr:hypothetical protein PB72LOC_03331 [Pectobacterium atrosepticum]